MKRIRNARPLPAGMLLGVVLHLLVCSSARAGLLLYWQFDEGNATAARGDSSGNGYVGTVVGGPASLDASLPNGGYRLRFDGVDDDVYLSNPAFPTFADFGTNDFTVMMRVVPRWGSGDTGWDNAFALNKWSSGGATPGDNEWNLGIKGDDSNDFMPVFSFETGTTRYSAKGNPVDPSSPGFSRWHHLAGVRSNDTIILYWDGLPVDQSNVGSAPVNNAGRALLLGRNGRGAGSLYAKADFDDVQIYDEALAPEEILYIARHPGHALRLKYGAASYAGAVIAATEPVAYWDHDSLTTGDAAAELADLQVATGGVNVAGAVGSAVGGDTPGPRPVDGLAGMSGNNMGTALDGDGDAVRYGVVEAGAGVSPTNYSMQVWFKTTDAWDYDGKPVSALLARGAWDDGGQDAVFVNGVFHAGEGENVGELLMSAGSEGSRSQSWSDIVLASNAWYHLVMTREGTALKAFLNGVEVTSLDVGYAGSSGSHVVYGGDTRYTAGSRPDLQFKGIADECALWDRALSEDEIQFLYGVGRSVSGLLLKLR